jgi:hypothetical protein
MRRYLRSQHARHRLGQTEYPRKRFFDEIVAVMPRSRRFVPLYNDKHLSFRWDWAREMYDAARQLGIRFLAGSLVPLAQRVPPLELVPGTELAEAVSIHGGGLESYDFHGFEVLQSVVESCKGGEPGITRVEFLAGTRCGRRRRTATGRRSWSRRRWRPSWARSPRP